MSIEQWLIVIVCGVAAGYALEKAGMKPWPATLTASATFGTLTWLVLTLNG